MEPTELTYHQLKEFTDDFSEGRKLGEGAYGKVYMGVDKNGQEIAVKLLHNGGTGLHDEAFKNEFYKLKGLNHRHTVKLIGYCYETRYKPMEYNGKSIFAERTERALCMEYMHNRSLQDHLSKGICDGQLDWHTCFKIIKGASEGIKYLHEELKEPIYHLDLKPGNILLDINMVPKLADFGLSRIFSREQTQITMSCTGTVGYMPPEYIEEGVISKMFDIFSLGVVMINTISGSSGRNMTHEMPEQEFIDLVHDSWRVKLQEKWSGFSLEAYCQQVKRCSKIALTCVEVDRKKRPNIVDIVRELSEMETTANEISRCPGGEILSVYPFKLVFPCAGDYKSSKQSWVPCPLHLTNNTDHDIKYRLLIPHQNEFFEPFMGKVSGLVPPRTTHTCFLTMVRPRAITANGYQFFTLKSWINDSEVHQMKLMALYEPTGPAGKNAPSEILTALGGSISIDLHPSEPWIMIHQQHSSITIFNYETQRIKRLSIPDGEDTIGEPRMPLLECCLFFLWDFNIPPVTSVKLIARKKWIAVGDRTGSIQVLSYDPPRIILHIKHTHSRSILSMATHPTEPYLLSASMDGYIQLRDYEKGWQLMRVFGSWVFPWQPSWDVYQNHVVFNPKNPNTFASVQGNRIKSQASNMETRKPDITYHHDEVLTIRCLNYFSGGNQLYLIGGFSEGIIKIWDIQSMECVKTLETTYGDVTAACSHTDLPVLITGSEDGYVCLWNSTTFKLERVLSFGLGPVRALECLKGTRRIVIAHRRGIALTEIGTEQTGDATEEAI